MVFWPRCPKQGIQFNVPLLVFRARDSNPDYKQSFSFLSLREVRLKHREPTQSVWVADCYFIVNVLDLPFASPIAIYRQLCI